MLDARRRARSRSRAAAGSARGPAAPRPARRRRRSPRAGRSARAARRRAGRAASRAPAPAPARRPRRASRARRTPTLLTDELRAERGHVRRPVRQVGHLGAERDEHDRGREREPGVAEREQAARRRRCPRAQCHAGEPTMRASRRSAARAASAAAAASARARAASAPRSPRRSRTRCRSATQRRRRRTRAAQAARARARASANTASATAPTEEADSTNGSTKQDLAPVQRALAAFQRLFDAPLCGGVQCGCGAGHPSRIGATRRLFDRVGSATRRL